MSPAEAKDDNELLRRVADHFAAQGLTGLPILLHQTVALPPFHPLINTDATARHPETELTARVFHIKHVWEEMQFLGKLGSEREALLEQRILFKHVLTTLHCLFDELDKLHGLLNRLPDRSPDNPIEALTPAERKEIQDLFRVHFQARKKASEDVAAVRNGIAAHQRFVPIEEQIALWAKTEPHPYLAVINTIPSIWRYIRTLPIYIWSREPEPGAIVFEIQMERKDSGENLGTYPQDGI